MRKIFSAILVIAILCSVASVSVFASEDYIDLVEDFGATIGHDQAGGSNAYTDLDDASTDSKWVFTSRGKNGMGRTFKITGLNEESLEAADIRYVEFSMNFKQLSDKTHNYIDFRAKGKAKPNLIMALTSGYTAQTNYINIGKDAVNDVRIIRDRETKTTYLYINKLLAAMYVFTDGTTTTELDDLYEFGFAFYNGGTETEGAQVFEVTRMKAKGWTSDATADDMKIYNGYIKNGMVWRSMGKAITNLSASESVTNSNLSVTCHIPAYQDGILKRAFGATSQTTGANISGYDVNEAYMWNTTTMEPYSMPTGILSLD